LGWLAVILRIDAVISPGGTGLIYNTTTSRLSFGLSKNGFVPEIFEATSKKQGAGLRHHHRGRRRRPLPAPLPGLECADRPGHQRVGADVHGRAARARCTALLEAPAPPPLPAAHRGCPLPAGVRLRQ